MLADEHLPHDSDLDKLFMQQEAVADAKHAARVIAAFYKELEDGGVEEPADFTHRWMELAFSTEEAQQSGAPVDGGIE